MRAKVLLLLLLAAGSRWSDLSAQVLFQKSVTVGYSAHGTSIAQTSDSGFFVSASVKKSSNIEGYYPPTVIKTDARGEVQWMRRYYGGLGMADGITALPDGGALVLASILTDVTGMISLVLIRLDSAGNVVWANGFVDIGTGNNSQIILTPDSACIIGASPFPLFSKRSGLVKIDLSGQVVWAVSFTSSQSPYIEAIEQLTDGSIVCGVTLSTQTPYYAELYRFSSTGEALWTRQLEPRNEITGIAKTSDGGFVVCGLDGTTKVNEGNAFIAKFDSSGTQLWGQRVDADRSERVYSITEGPNGDLIAVGSHGNRALFIRLNASGGIVSVKGCSFDTVSIAYSVVPITRDRYAVTGSINGGNGESGASVWIMNLDTQMENCHLADLPFGLLAMPTPGDSMTVVATEDSIYNYFITSAYRDTLLFVATDLCDQVSVQEITNRPIEIFPNPVSDVLNLSFTSQTVISYRVVICDNLGRVVKQSVIDPGNTPETVVMDGLPDGVYFGVLRGANLTYHFKFLKSGE